MTGAMKTGCQPLKSLWLVLCIVAFTAAASLTANAEGEFLSAIDDLPLMTGLSEVDGSVMVFDSPSGRIVETLTMGNMTEARILTFYSETLPQLGWTESTPGHFSREDEVLMLDFPQAMTPSGASPTGTPPTVARFMLSPAK